MQDLPVFPLPVVLLPGAPMPLHIFEARYRQMMAHCIESDKRFVLVYHDPDESGPFRVEGQVGCVARILEFQPIPDGRSLVLVEGEERVRLVDEGESESMYYRAVPEPYTDEDESPPGVDERRAVSMGLFQNTFSRISEHESEIPVIDPARDISFQLARWIRTAPQWHQRLLESRVESDRLDMIDFLFREALEEMQ
jgi:Lon protease-like protein